MCPGIAVWPRPGEPIVVGNRVVRILAFMAHQAVIDTRGLKETEHQRRTIRRERSIIESIEPLRGETAVFVARVFCNRLTLKELCLGWRLADILDLRIRMLKGVSREHRRLTGHANDAKGRTYHRRRWRRSPTPRNPAPGFPVDRNVEPIPSSTAPFVGIRHQKSWGGRSR